MTDTVTLKPAPDVRVRKEDGALLAAAGEPVPLNAYWRRRLADEDVVAVSPKPKTRSDAQ
ncbi:DUF2635 domain-containing protein [Sphingomonas sp. TX0522]|uniref:DUF2635 domain-containing protein n=1 Tax=Sphingomonas sp. TX0522 TaxID=2479205 RepID=UPI0018DF90B2|nr:DUF2635 domain-containing protein [Sphingomonas sp. TX0522]MBI0530092.1 DUF2635 domain-containing protein [Sphingomonas sp. TX0522]